MRSFISSIGRLNWRIRFMRRKLRNYRMMSRKRNKDWKVRISY